MKFLSTLLFLFITTFCFAQNNYQDLDEAIEKGKSKKSEKLLTEIAAEESKIFIAFLEMGQFYYKHGELNKAVEYLEYAIIQAKNAPLNYQDTNFVHTKDSLYKLSVIIMDELIKIEPSNLNYARRASLKADLGLFIEAILDFNISISLDSLNANIYYNRGNVYRKLAILDSAILDYSKAIKLNPELASAYSNKGFTHLLLDEYQLALIAFENAFKYTKGIKSMSYIINNIGYTHYKLENYDLALELVNESIRINPINSYAYKNLALIEIALGKSKSACKSIKKSIELGFVDQYGDEIIEIQNENCGNVKE